MNKSSLEFKLFIYWFLGSALGFFLLIGLLGLAYILGEKPPDDLILKINGFRIRPKWGGEGVPIIFPEAVPFVIIFIFLFFFVLITAPFLSKLGKDGEPFFKIYPAFAFGSVFPLIFATQNSINSFIIMFIIFVCLTIFLIFRYGKTYVVEKVNLLEILFTFLSGYALLLSLLGTGYIIDPKSSVFIERFSDLNLFYKLFIPIGFIYFFMRTLKIWKNRKLCDAYVFGIVYALSVITISSSFYKDIILGLGLFLISLLFTQVRNLG